MYHVINTTGKGNDVGLETLRRDLEIVEKCVDKKQRAGTRCIGARSDTAAANSEQDEKHDEEPVKVDGAAADMVHEKPGADGA